MIKVYIDTNCYIQYAQGKLSQFKHILTLQRRGEIKIFCQPNLKSELLSKPSVPPKEKQKIVKTLTPLDYREGPFTLGISRLDGPDYVSRFPNKKEKPEDVTIPEVKSGIQKALFPTKQSLSKSDKEDVELYSEAVSLGCEYFITQNTRDFGKARSGKRKRIENFDERVKPTCKIRAVDEFLKEIGIVERNTKHD